MSKCSSSKVNILNVTLIYFQILYVNLMYFELLGGDTVPVRMQGDVHEDIPHNENLFDEGGVHDKGKGVQQQGKFKKLFPLIN